MMVAELQTMPSFAVTERRELFEDTFDRNVDHRNYDVHPVTGEFLMIKGTEVVSELVIVLNWFEELKERVGN